MQLEAMGNPALEKWGRWAIARWKETDPEKYQGLLEAGMLEDAGVLAQEEAKNLYVNLVHQGMEPLQAKEIALATYILTETYEPEDWEIEGAEADRDAEIEKHLT